MLFFKSRFSHRGAALQRGRARETERQSDDHVIHPSVPPSLRPSVSRSLRLYGSVALWLALAALVPQLAAQEAQDKQRQDKQSEMGTIRLNTDLVTVDAIVTDRDGNRVSGVLKASDFVIYEDGVRQAMNSFSATDAPVKLGLFLDTSG